MFLNPLLYKLYGTNLGAKIGEVDCTAPATADNLMAISDSKPALQTLVSTSDDCIRMEHYLLQPVESVVMLYSESKKSYIEDSDSSWTIYGKAMSLVEETSHMGLLRSSASDNTPVFENKKESKASAFQLDASWSPWQQWL